MKNSLTGAAGVLKGFAGWIYGRRGENLSPVDPSETSAVVWACGRRAPTDDELADRREFAGRSDRWSPGLSLDNFS
jgi:hypothetical protein